MLYLTSINDYAAGQPAAVTVGKFDGVHLGHKLLTERLCRQKEKGMVTVAVTFDIQPLWLTENRKDVKLIITPAEKRHMLAEAGVDVLLELPFDDTFMHMSPEAFIRMLKERLDMEYMVVGSDFKFGYRGAGDIGQLKDLSVMHHFALEVVEKKQCNKRDISSTYIREEIAAGHIKNAARLLGYPYYIYGEIVHGNRIGSTKLDFPTINMIPSSEKLLPPNGVYITEVSVEGRIYKGVTNVGIRPTIAEHTKTVGVETHILDFRADIYEKHAKVVFLDFIRQERAFASLDALREQIASDVKTALRYFNDNNR